MTVLLCIDTALNRVRRYHPRRPGGLIRMTEEVWITRPQCDTLPQQLESLRLQRPMQFADVPPLEAA